MSNTDFDEFENDTPRKAPARKAAAKKAPAKRAPAKKAASKIPPTAKQPQDRKKPAQSGTKARRREADGIEVVDIPITVKGESMAAEIPLHQGDWPVRAAQHFARRNHLDAIEALFGPEQWAEFLDLNPTLNDLDEVGRVVSKELGMESPGN